MKLSEIAERIGCELKGDGSVEIAAVAPIEHATSGDITFVANDKYRVHLENTAASAVIVKHDEDFSRLPTLRTKEPYLSFARVVDLFHPTTRPSSGIHPTAVVDGSARIAKNASVGPLAVIGKNCIIGDNSVIGARTVLSENVTIGADCTIHPGVTMMNESQIGDRVIIHPGVVIGADGFGYASSPEGHKKIRQVGNVVIESDVEIGANCTIDRAALGSTRIGAGTKIDNLVQIAHNVQIGKNCIIVSQAGISGSSKLGDWTTIAGQVGIIGHLKLGSKVIVTAQSGVTKDIPDGKTVFGSPARDIGHARRIEAVVNNLPELSKRVSALEKALKTTDEKQDSD